MGAYEYTALDSAGQSHKGVLEGDTARHVRALLREKALLPVAVAEVVARGEPVCAVAAFGLLRRVSTTELRSPDVHPGARRPAPGGGAKPSRSRPSGLRRASCWGCGPARPEGHTLAAGLAISAVFPEIYRATVAAGEQSGHLDVVLERLAEYTEGREVLRQKVLGAMLYPIVLTVMSFGIVSILLAYVVPKVVQVFENSHAQLPFMTRVLVAFSDFIRHYGIWLVLVLVAAGVLFERWQRAPAHRRRVDQWLLTLPLAGKLLRGFNTARFTRTLSILTASAVPVLDALRISGEVVTSLPMRDAVTEATARVREGAPIGRSLAASRLFPPMTIHLISSGESSGRLENMLERAAINQERELESLVTAPTGSLGPC